MPIFYISELFSLKETKLNVLDSLSAEHKSISPIFHSRKTSQACQGSPLSSLFGCQVPPKNWNILFILGLKYQESVQCRPEIPHDRPTMTATIPMLPRCDPTGCCDLVATGGWLRPVPRSGIRPTRRKSQQDMVRMCSDHVQITQILDW